MEREKRKKLWVAFAFLFTVLAFISIGTVAAHVPDNHTKIQLAGSAAINLLNDKDTIISNEWTCNKGIHADNAVSSETVSEHSFDYTITATGTENKVVYPDQSFAWTVTGTGTETWYTFPNQNFIWTVTGTGTETWYEQMPDEGDPADYGFYQSGSAWYKDGKQVTQYGVLEFRVIGGKPFWKYGGSYYYNSMTSYSVSGYWGYMGEVTQSSVTCFCVIGGKAFWKYGGKYYHNDLSTYKLASSGWSGWDGTWGFMGKVAQSGVSEFQIIGGKPFWKYGGKYYHNDLSTYKLASSGWSGWDGTWGHMGEATQSGVSEFLVHDGRPYWKYYGNCYYNDLSSYKLASSGWGGWDGTWNYIKETSCPLPSPDVSIDPCAFGSHTATRTATDSGSSAVTKTDGEKFISTFSAMPQPQQGGTISGVTYSITDNNANVNTWISGNSVYASTSYSETNTAIQTATDSGSGTVNNPEGDKDMGTFSAHPQPEQGGTISGVIYSISDNNPEVDTWISGSHVYARTDYSEIQAVPWSGAETGSGSVNASEGDKYITTSTLVAPNDDTAWSVSDDSDYVETWMDGSELYARVAFLPIHNLNTSLNYSTIQTAIDAVETIDGHTITVDPGTYAENVNVDKELTIRSTSGNPADTIVQAANSNDHVFEVIADCVNVSGFTVTGATGSWKAGIYLGNWANHCDISDNNASNNYHGIYLWSSSSNMLTNNTASNNEYGIYQDYSSNNTLKNNTANSNNWDGIRLYSSSNNNIMNNTFVNDGLYVYNSYQNTVEDNTVNDKPLVYLEDASDHTITDAGQVVLVKCDNITVKNLVLSNTEVGIELWATDNSRIMNNTANSNNHAGIILSYSSNNMLENNTANSNNNWGILLYSSGNNTLENNTANSNNHTGIRLVDSSSNNTLENNTANSNNWDGISLCSSSNNTLTGNTANSNKEHGISMAHFSSNNLIYNNYFDNANNAFDYKYDENNIWNITKTEGTNIIGGPYLGGNYWSDYAGEDTDEDGLGDTLLPYNSSGNIANGGDYLPLIAAPINNPPIASFTFSPVTPLVGETITFNATNSTDPDGTIVSYEWNFGDGNITSTTDQIITHSYASAGDYNVTLTVTDNEGANDTDTTTIVVTSGGFQWVKFWGESDDEYGKGIFIADGDIYVSGYTNSIGAGNYDSLLLKYDLSGNDIWNKTWGGSHYDGANRLHISDSNIYVTGSTVSFAYDPVGDLECDAAILKYNPSGDLLWNITWGNYPGYSGSDSLYDVYAVGNDIYAVGISDVNWGNRVSLLQKYDADGNLIWTRFWGPEGSGYPDGLMTIGQQLVVSGSDIHVVGCTQSVMGAPYDAVLLKYDTLGNLIWNRTWGGTERDFAYGVAVSGTGIYVAGYTNSLGTGGYDVFILKYDSAGNLLWDTTWGGSEDDFGYDIFISDNSIYIAGSTESFGADGEDAFILKCDASGNHIWHETWGGVSDDLANGLFVSENDIFVTGTTESFGSGNSDVFLIKFNEVEKSDIVISKIWVNLSDNCMIRYNVTNTGNETALLGHNTTLYVDGVKVAFDYVPEELAPGENYTGCFDDYIWAYTPPSDNITVCADCNNTIAESNETNNCMYNTWMCGDVNEDGTVNVLDVLGVYRRALDPHYPLAQPWAADVNCDGTINVLDVLGVYRRALDPEYNLNCCCEV